MKETVHTEKQHMEVGSGTDATKAIMPVSGFHEVTTESSDSIEVTKNTKGYTWSVKLYLVPGIEDTTLERMTWIQARLHQIYGEQAQNGGEK